MIFAADIHLRRTRPTSRIDDYAAAQEKKYRFVLEQAAASPPLLVSGDLFDKSRPGEALLYWVINLHMEYGIKPIVVPGQHDLPYHSLDRIGESGIGVLESAGVITILEEFIQPRILATGSEIIWGCAYGQKPHQSMHDNQRFNILLWHHMVIEQPLWPGQEAEKAPAILRKYPQFDIIVTGDNHQTHYTHLNRRTGTGRWLVNPGSMMRMTAAQANHKPCIFKWEDGKMEQLFLPIEPADEVLDVTRIEKEKDRDARIGAFVERLQGGYEVELSFERNLEEHLRANKVEDEVKQIIWEVVGE